MKRPSTVLDFDNFIKENYSINENTDITPLKFECIQPGRIGISKGEARSAEVKLGDIFTATSEDKYHYFGDLQIKGKFSHQPGLSGKKTDPKPFTAKDIIFALTKTNIDNPKYKDNEFFAQFKPASTNESNISEDGYGDAPFQAFKAGDAFNYFFKMNTDGTHRCMVLTIGKFSKFAQPTENKQDYGVISIIEIDEAKLDQAVLDKGKFETNSATFVVSDRELSNILTKVAECVSDYLQKNPKVSKFYDEIEGNLKNVNYMKLIQDKLEKWPGGQGAWHVQELEKGKLNIINK